MPIKTPLRRSMVGTVLTLFGWLMGGATSPLPSPAHASPPPADRLIAFYVPWDQASLSSLQRNAAQIDVVAAAWISVTGPGHVVTAFADPAGHVALAALPHRPPLWLMVQNALNGRWDGGGAAALLNDTVASRALLDQIDRTAANEHAAGLIFDFEALPPSAQAGLARFLVEARARCQRHGWTLTATAPVDDPAWDLASLGRIADRIVLMAYDEHWQSGAPGPIASNPWFASVISHAIRLIPPGRAVIGVASYAYDWPQGRPASVLSIAQATELARRTGIAVMMDPASGNRHFAYTDHRTPHQVWMMSAATVDYQVGLARSAGAGSVALWRLGTEDPAIWAPR